MRDTGTVTTRGAADSAADTHHGVEGAARNTRAPAANAVHGTSKGYGTLISCEILPRAENGVGILGPNDASRYGAAGSSQSAGSSLGDGATRLAKNVGSSVASGNTVKDGVTSNVKSSFNDSAKGAVKGTGSEILGRETGTGVLNAARGTVSGVASSLRDSARESVRDNSSSGSAGSVLSDTGNYGMRLSPSSHAPFLTSRRLLQCELAQNKPPRLHKLRHLGRIPHFWRRHRPSRHWPSRKHCGRRGAD